MNPHFEQLLDNDFQWKNLYLQQYGSATYAPPVPKNPSTTNRYFPKRRDLASVMEVMQVEDDMDMDLDDTSMQRNDRFDDGFSFQSRPGNKNATGRLNGQGRDDDFGSRPVTSSNVRGGNTGEGNDVLFELLKDDDFFSPNFFDFLKVKKPFGSREGTTPLPPLVRRDSLSITFRQHSRSNPHDLPEEMFQLESDTWLLLMDNRAMAWLEREASAKSRTAASLRRKLLEAAAGPRVRRAGGLMDWRTLDVQSLLIDPISEEEAFQRVYESFSMFFASISPPQNIKQLKDQFTSAKRPQSRENSDKTADIVGMTLFSQFSTWKETYEHRKAWGPTPFSFFLMHDCSFNFAQISAIYSMLELIREHSHTHSQACIAHLGEAISTRQAVELLAARRRSVKKPIDQSGDMCPLLLIRQLTEDLMIAFEHSSSRSTLSMAMSVLGFLTETVLHPEVASLFVSRRAIERQINFKIPGYDIVKRFTNNEARGSNNHSSSPKPVVEVINVMGTSYKDNGADIDKEVSMGDPARSREKEALDFFPVKPLSETEFDSLFELGTWFLDAPTANRNLPIDKTLVASQKMIVHPSMSNWEHASSGTASPRSRGTATGSPNKKSNRPEPLTVETCPYTPGRQQRFWPVSTVTEAIIRYEAHRQALLERRIESLAAAVSNSRATGVPQLGKHQKGRNRGSKGGSLAIHINEEDTQLNLTLSATSLASPVIFFTSYLRLHGATWIKNLFVRLFNILRRESVQLYVNRLALQEPPSDLNAEEARRRAKGRNKQTLNSSFLSSSDLSINDRSPRHQEAANYYYKMEQLEDLVCQDIQYVMDEFFNALYGKRAATRLPHGITSLLSQFCASIHLHLLGQYVSSGVPDSTLRLPNACRRVLDLTNALKQKNAAGNLFRKDAAHSNSSTERLIQSVEQYRLAKFLLFDCWIISSLNNAIDAGFIAENSSNHLRWNIDAFARYLKILVNAPFTNASSIEARAKACVTPNTEALSFSLSANRKKSRTKSIITTPAQIALPAMITGIYDISSGSLVRLLPPKHSADSETISNQERLAAYVFGEDNLTVSNVFSPEATLRSFGSPTFKRNPSVSILQALEPAKSSASLRGDEHFKVMDNAGWDELSGALRSLNEALGVVGYDPEEIDPDDDQQDSIGPKGTLPMRALDRFCHQASMEGVNNVVVSEFEVSPSVAAACVEKLYRIVTGTHPAVESVIREGALGPVTLSVTPYLLNLGGVLLHPYYATRALDNVYGNSRSLYHALMKPIQDESISALFTSLLNGQAHDFPLVDSNSVLPLLSMFPLYVRGKGMKDGVHSLHTISQSVSNHARQLKREHMFLATGATASVTRMQSLLWNSHPDDPLRTLHAGEQRIREELGVHPITFDLWWRSLVVALSVKAMNVLMECSPNRSRAFEDWCGEKLKESNILHKRLCNAFVNRKGGIVEVRSDKLHELRTPKKRTRKLQRAASPGLEETSTKGRYKNRKGKGGRSQSAGKQRSKK